MRHIHIYTSPLLYTYTHVPIHGVVYIYPTHSVCGYVKLEGFYKGLCLSFFSKGAWGVGPHRQGACRYICVMIMNVTPIKRLKPLKILYPIKYSTYKYFYP